jgi:LysM repeat protein
VGIFPELFHSILHLPVAYGMEVPMNAKKFLQLFILTAVLLASFASTSAAFAAGCGSSVVVESGDTLLKIANRCGTTVSALRLANPQLGSGNLIYPGQSLALPGAILGSDGGFFIYIVARGDTLKGLAIRFGSTVDALLAANPAITNANVIYEGQQVKVYVSQTPPPQPPPPSGGQVYYIQRGDTLRKIASKFSTTVDALLRANPQISNPNVIYVGQAITIPAGVATYVVQQGDSLRMIANRFGMTVDNLLRLNPDIKNPNLIYVGQVINVQ